MINKACATTAETYAIVQALCNDTSKQHTPAVLQISGDRNQLYDGSCVFSFQPLALLRRLQLLELGAITRTELGSLTLLPNLTQRFEFSISKHEMPNGSTAAASHQLFKQQLNGTREAHGLPPTGAFKISAVA